jgi:hypothetical protein
MKAAKTLLLLVFVATMGAAARSQEETSALRIKTDVMHVEVLLDGENVGQTPLTLSSVKPGLIKLTFIKPGFEDETREVNAVAGKTVSLFVVMKKIQEPLPDLPIRFRGVHEHIKGRCYGQLVVYHDRIEYKAETEPDSFLIPIASINFLSRSTGPLFTIVYAIPTDGGAYIGAAGWERKNPGGVLPVRVETKERKYGFWVYNEDGEAATITTSLYLLLSRLIAEQPVSTPAKK